MLWPKFVSIIMFVACIEFGTANDVKHSLTEKFAWKSIEFAWRTDAEEQDAQLKKYYISENNLPMGIDVWSNKLFITIPRWKLGVASSLNYVNLMSAQNELNPKLVPYPSWDANLIKIDHRNESQPNASQTPAVVELADDPSRIVSPFQIRVDECNRLWVLDTGVANILDKPIEIAPPALVIFNLMTNELIKRYTFPKSVIIENHSLFANVIVDVTKDECNNAYAYVADLLGYGLVVYSLKDNKSWRVKHNFFHFDPMSGDFNVGGVNFQLADGVLGMALGKANQHGIRTVYFHPLSSTKEFAVQNSILKNETRSTSPSSYYDFMLLGDRGPKGQSSAEFFDENTNTLFYTQVQKDAINCWLANKTYTTETQGTVDTNSDVLVFPNDVKIDGNGSLWVLSNRMPVFHYAKLRSDQINYRILVGKANEVIKGTPCDPNYDNTKKP